MRNYRSNYKMKHLTIAISPCPNDTFIFEALYNKLIINNVFDFNFLFEDIATLNDMASEQKADVVKVSYAHYFKIADDYVLSKAGGAMGNGVGPLLISKNYIAEENFSQIKVAIPGDNTTAHFLLQHAFPFIKNKVVIPFHKIENAVLNNEVDAGVIIHENRFSYLEKKLTCLHDLGTVWEQKTQLPIPLGAIAIRRSLPTHVQRLIDMSIAQSVLLALKNKNYFSTFICQHAQEMQKEIIKKHIELYVNDFSVDIGEKGLQAIKKMQSILKPNLTKDIFLQ